MHRPCIYSLVVRLFLSKKIIGSEAHYDLGEHVRRTNNIILQTLLLIGLITITLCVQQVKTYSTTIIVPDDYPTIQEAINHADEGDIIFVKAGLYIESVIVNKTVSIIGENRETTIIEPDPETQFRITADNVEIKSFKFRKNWLYAVWVESSNCLIENNNITGSLGFGGIFLDGRMNNVTGNIVTNNHIVGTDECGVIIWTGCRNEISFNTITDNFSGVYIEENSNDNLVFSNNIEDNRDSGIIFVWYSSNNAIINNNVSGNGWLDEVYICGIGFQIGSQGNRIISNRILGNRRGVYQGYASSNNILHHNSFIDNAIQVLDDSWGYPDIVPHSINIWDNNYPHGGNYWSDYDGNDTYSGPYQNITGSDELGDIPYIIDMNNTDRYPLMAPYVPILGDLNYDTRVDITDVAIGSSAFGSYPGHPRWNSLADANQDGKINIMDIAVVSANFGKYYEP